MENIEVIGWKMIADFSEVDRKFQESQRKLSNFRRDAETRGIRLKIDIDTSAAQQKLNNLTKGGNGAISAGLGGIVGLSSSGRSINTSGVSPNQSGGANVLSSAFQAASANVFAGSGNSAYRANMEAIKANVFAGAAGVAGFAAPQVQVTNDVSGYVAGGRPCPQCGKVNPPGATYCRRCGNQLIATAFKRPNIMSDVVAGVKDVAKMGAFGAKAAFTVGKAGYKTVKAINEGIDYLTRPAPVTLNDLLSAQQASGVGIQEAVGHLSNITDLLKNNGGTRRRRRRPRGPGGGGGQEAQPYPLRESSPYPFSVGPASVSVSEGIQAAAERSIQSTLQPISYSGAGSGGDLTGRQFLANYGGGTSGTSGSLTQVLKDFTAAVSTATRPLQTFGKAVEAVSSPVSARPGARMLTPSEDSAIRPVETRYKVNPEDVHRETLEGLGLRSRRNSGFARIPGTQDFKNMFNDISGFFSGLTGGRPSGVSGPMMANGKFSAVRNIPGLDVFDQPGKVARSLGVPRWASSGGGVYSAVSLISKGLESAGSSVTGFQDNRSAAMYFNARGPGAQMGMSAQDFYNAQLGKDPIANAVMNAPFGIGSIISKPFYNGLAGITGTTGKINRQQTLALIQQQKLDQSTMSQANRLALGTQSALNLNTDRFQAINIQTQGDINQLTVEGQARVKADNDAGNTKDAAKDRAAYFANIASRQVAGTRQFNEAKRSFNAGIQATLLAPTSQLNAGIQAINSNNDLTSPQGRAAAGAQIQALKQSYGMETTSLQRQNKVSALDAHGLTYDAAIQAAKNNRDDALDKMKGDTGPLAAARRTAIQIEATNQIAGVNRQKGIDIATDTLNWSTRKNIANAQSSSLYDINHAGDAAMAGLKGQQSQELADYKNSGRMTPQGLTQMQATQQSERNTLTATSQKQIADTKAGFNIQLENIQNATAAQLIANKHKPAQAEGYQIEADAMTQVNNYRPSGMGKAYDTKMKKAILSNAAANEEGILARYDYHNGSTINLGGSVAPGAMQNPYAEKPAEILNNIHGLIDKIHKKIGSL